MADARTLPVDDARSVDRRPTWCCRTRSRRGRTPVGGQASACAAGRPRLRQSSALVGSDRHAASKSTGSTGRCRTGRWGELGSARRAPGRPPRRVLAVEPSTVPSSIDSCHGRASSRGRTHRAWPARPSRHQAAAGRGSPRLRSPSGLPPRSPTAQRSTRRPTRTTTSSTSELESRTSHGDSPRRSPVTDTTDAPRWTQFVTHVSNPRSG